MERRIRLLLEELSELLRDVISDSPAAVEKVDAIQEEGYAIHLLLDCKPADEDLDDERFFDDEGPEVTGLGTPDSAQVVASDDSLANAPSASFRINAADLHFLKSVGIDPTRRPNRKRYRPPSETPQSGD